MHPILQDKALNGGMMTLCNIGIMSIIIFLFIDFMTMDEVYQIVKRMDQLSPKAHTVLADKLDVPLVPRAAYLRGWRSLYTILFQWELQRKDSGICGSKAQLMQILLQVAADSQLEERDKEVLKNTVQDS